MRLAPVGHPQVGGRVAGGRRAPHTTTRTPRVCGGVLGAAVWGGVNDLHVLPPGGLEAVVGEAAVPPSPL